MDRCTHLNTHTSFHLFIQDSSDEHTEKSTLAVADEEPKSKLRSTTVDLATDTTLMVDISDALSEQEKVKFTVHTKVDL